MNTSPLLSEEKLPDNIQEHLQCAKYHFKRSTVKTNMTLWLFSPAYSKMLCTKEHVNVFWKTAVFTFHGSTLCVNVSVAYVTIAVLNCSHG